MMDKLVIATMTERGMHAEALLMARSLRQFGGGLADAPLWVWFPDADEHRPPAAICAQLAALDVALLPFEPSPDALTFPLAAKVFAAAEAENRAEVRAECFAWLDPDTVILQAPHEFLLPAETTIACAPVHHRLIGSRYDEAPDDFWSLIYARCAAPPERLYPMHTLLESAPIRPYFNAGSLVVRPQRGLLRAWRDAFTRLYCAEEFQPFYTQHALYRVFMHQAVLSAVILSQTEPEERVMFSPRVNYPLHLHDEYPAVSRINDLTELLTCRVDVLLQQPDWAQALPGRGLLHDWLIAQWQEVSAYA